MSAKAAITVNRPRDEVERLWREPSHRPPSLEGSDASVTFKDAPGDRGVEIHVDLGDGAGGGKLGSLFRGASTIKVKDDLRRFKQRVETGEIPRSDATPEGESGARKLKQRPAQPLPESETAGAR